MSHHPLIEQRMQQELTKLGPKKPKKKKIEQAPVKRNRRTKKQKRADLKSKGMEARRLPYKEYLNSDWWYYRRWKAIKRARFRCERCKKETWLQVHHKSYERLGCELDKDLEALCRKCHEYEHSSLIAAYNHLDAITGK